MKQQMMIFAGLVGMVLLVVVAFLAGRFLPVENGDVSAASVSGSTPANENRVIVMDQGSGPVRITFAEAAGLPNEPPAQEGVFERLEDNTVFLGTGSIEVGMEVINDEVTVSTDYDGPVVEVVITGDTVLYEDVTEMPILSPEDVAKGEMVVQRVIELVNSLDNLGENMIVRVWGEQRGDRIIATVLVYEQVK